MAATDATTFAIKGQAFRLSGSIIDVSTGNPITGGLTSLTASISKDGGAFSATGVTATEIGTTGYFTLDINATGMTADTVIVAASSSDTGAVVFAREIITEPLTELTGRAADETVVRPMDFLYQVWKRFFNVMTANRDTGAVVLYNDNGTTSEVSGTNSTSGATETRGAMS